MPASQSFIQRSPHSSPSPHSSRRFQWVFVRLEVELRKIQAHRPEVGVLVPPAGQVLHPHHGANGVAHANGAGGKEGSDDVELSKL